MRFVTLFPLLLAAGVAHAQFGQKQQGQNGQNGQNGQAQNNQNGQNTQAQNGQNGQNTQAQNGQNGQNNQGQGDANALCLNAANVQKASAVDGLAQAEAGQAASLTDASNFINHCTGKTLTNGLQLKQGSCNGIPMGDIPASSQMVSSVIISPANGQDIAANTAIDFTVRIANLVAGTFTNPDITYYAAPQTLQGGKVVGHTHFTVQDIGQNANPQQPLNAETFAFFKGINDNGNGNGELTTNLAEGLPAGNYRACTLTSSSNHQLVLMPIAQRGAQDDCVRFTVGAGNAGGNNNNNQANAQNGQNGQAQNGQNGQAQNGQNGQAQNGQNGQAQNGQAQNGQAQNGQAQNGQRRGRGRFGRTKFAARAFAA